MIFYFDFNSFMKSEIENNDFFSNERKKKIYELEKKIDEKYNTTIEKMNAEILEENE